MKATKLPDFTGDAAKDEVLLVDWLKSTYGLQAVGFGDGDGYVRLYPGLKSTETVSKLTTTHIVVRVDNGQLKLRMVVSPQSKELTEFAKSTGGTSKSSVYGNHNMDYLYKPSIAITPAKLDTVIQGVKAGIDNLKQSMGEFYKNRTPDSVIPVKAKRIHDGALGDKKFKDNEDLKAQLGPKYKGYDVEWNSMAKYNIHLSKNDTGVTLNVIDGVLHIGGLRGYFAKALGEKWGMELYNVKLATMYMYQVPASKNYYQPITMKGVDSILKDLDELLSGEGNRQREFYKNRQPDSMKTIHKCGACDTQVSDSANFCPSCGGQFINDKANPYSWLEGRKITLPGRGEVTVRFLEEQEGDLIIFATAPSGEKIQVSYNAVKAKGFEFPPKERKQMEPRPPSEKVPSLRTKLGVITKAKYESILKSAMKQAKGDGFEEETHDIATSMIYDPEISAYLEWVYPRLTQRGRIVQLQTDLENYI